MRWFFRLLRLLLGVHLVLMIVIFTLRLLPPPPTLQALGFDRCNGAPCVNRSLNIQDFIGRRTTLGWVIAWLGTPCKVNLDRGSNITLTYPSAEVYAVNTRGFSERAVASEPLWSVELTRKDAAASKTCDNTTGMWTGFDSSISISAGAVGER
jgi:hypothetical protein